MKVWMLADWDDDLEWYPTPDSFGVFATEELAQEKADNVNRVRTEMQQNAVPAGEGRELRGGGVVIERRLEPEAVA